MLLESSYTAGGLLYRLHGFHPSSRLVGDRSIGFRSLWDPVEGGPLIGATECSKGGSSCQKEARNGAKGAKRRIVNGQSTIDY